MRSDTLTEIRGTIGRNTTMFRFGLLLACALLVGQAYGQTGFAQTIQQDDNYLRLNDRDNPQRCGGGHSCVDGQASCQGGSCVCAARYAWGDGTFACYKRNQIAAEIKNDPMVTTFNKEMYKFPFLCRYLITHVRTELKDKNGKVIGTCTFQAYGFNNRRRGKIFNFGFDVATRIKYNNGRRVKLSTRNYGIVKNKMPYIYTRGNKNQWKPNGPWRKARIYYSDTDNDIAVRLYGMDSNKQVIFKAAKCGFKMTFVPYDIIKRRKQARVPGVSVAIDEKHSPQFFGRPQTMALPPGWKKKSLLSGHTLNNLSVEKSMLYRAFTAGVAQNQPFGATWWCDAVGRTLGSCNRKRRAMALNGCYWMLEEPRFMRCYDKGFRSNKLMQLLNMCTSMYCGRSRNSCQSVLDKIKNSGCSQLAGVGALSRFMSGAMCPK